MGRQFRIGQGRKPQAEHTAYRECRSEPWFDTPSRCTVSTPNTVGDLPAPGRHPNSPVRTPCSCCFQRRYNLCKKRGSTCTRDFAISSATPAHRCKRTAGTVSSERAIRYWAGAVTYRLPLIRGARQPPRTADPSAGPSLCPEITVLALVTVIYTWAAAKRTTQRASAS